MRLRLLIVVATLPLVLFAAMPMLADGQSGRLDSLRSKIDEKRSQIAGKKRRERVLASDIAVWSRRIGDLQADISTLQARQARLQTDLDAKRARLSRVQSRLRAERARLARLRARLARSRVVLARRLVDLYKADKPDVITVVLEADGFADLLERSEFAKRVSEQDARIIRAVKAAKADATATAARLVKLEREARRVAAVIEARRNQVAATKGALVDRRDQYAAARSRKSTLLASTREDRHELEGDLSGLEREEARISAALQRAASANGYNPNVAGPVRTGAGGLIWPVNGPIVSPFGPRWGRLHAGVDIAAPTGTPIRAAAAGSVALLGVVGGYGNYVCVAHGGGLSTCYAHLSSYATSQGARVSRGQVIGSVGCTGHCYGPHLHFETRINGSPVNPAGYL
ncbi:MAG TPA: peptidoglycan DD-metalloendopeptidase family protein [Solirubrobacteraceae bacterium]|nr:peptidoglycan DD-metalloendopeptidase family protein [Solirubrobacteraceae bacterium]